MTEHAHKVLTFVDDVVRRGRVALMDDSVWNALDEPIGISDAAKALAYMRIKRAEIEQLPEFQEIQSGDGAQKGRIPRPSTDGHRTAIGILEAEISDLTRQ